MIPDCVKGEMTRNDIVESNIEEFNSKCAAKPEEQKSILKDKRRKGKNRVSSKIDHINLYSRVSNNSLDVYSLFLHFFENLDGVRYFRLLISRITSLWTLIKYYR